ncbi:MAG TPA: hypothetical protein VFJ06_07060 [Halococcus sp.]|nr:hypothetical protein [Halococcus sp.]
MNGVVRLYRRFKRWTEQLSRTQNAILVGIQTFLVWAILSLLFGGFSPIMAVYGALAFAGASYWFDPRERNLLKQ